MKVKKSTLPREVLQTYGNRVRNTDNSCCEKSAEAIVVLIRAISENMDGLTKYKGQNLRRCVVNKSYQMKERMQKIFEESKTCPQKNRTESEDYVGGQTLIWITETDAINNRIVN